jgi:hypothetical protein
MRSDHARALPERSILTVVDCNRRGEHRSLHSRNVYRHVTPLRGDRKALGGFFEAILAVMIVTSGFTILLVSVNLVQVEGQEGKEDVQGEIRTICQRLLDDERIFQPPYVLLLSNSFLWGEIFEDAMSTFSSYSVTLIFDLATPRSILLAQARFDDSSGEIISFRIPVDVQITSSTVHVGILEVKVGV